MGVSRRNGESGFEEAISGETPTLISGTHLESGTAQLTLVRALGEGAFSSVWLASDDGGTLPSPSESRSHPETLRRKSSSWAKKGRDKRMHGITPPATTNAGFSWKKTGSASDPDGSVVLDEQDGEGAIASADDPAQTVRPKGRLVAVKMINRALCDANDRTRISFVREVEVLRVSCYVLNSVGTFRILTLCPAAHSTSVHRCLSPFIHFGLASLPSVRARWWRGAL